MRVNYVKKATGSKKRPWPAEGKTCMKCRKPILKGQPYKWAKGRYSSKRIACGDCMFSRADLCDNIKAGIYSAFEESLKELENGDEMTDLQSILDNIIEVVRDVEQQYRDAAESFSGGGPNADNADECDSCASELEGINVPDIQEFEAWVEDNLVGQDVQSFEEWAKIGLDHLNENEGTLQEQYDVYIEEEMREPYNEYVTEEISGFAAEIESADTL